MDKLALHNSEKKKNYQSTSAGQDGIIVPTFTVPSETHKPHSLPTQ